MKERPILFNAEMVRAILDGRKTQTRRVITQDKNPHDFLGGIGEDRNDPYNWGFENPDVPSHFITLPEQRCPYGSKGDLLWVRENYCLPVQYNDFSPDECKGSAPQIHYIATDKNRDLWGKQRPSIHMPRWASRIDLLIKNIRVERLQDISEEDAWAEGGWEEPNLGFTFDGKTGNTDSMIYEFSNLWQSIHPSGPKSWEANPFVWVIEFERINP